MVAHVSHPELTQGIGHGEVAGSEQADGDELGEPLRSLSSDRNHSAHKALAHLGPAARSAPLGMGLYGKSQVAGRRRAGRGLISVVVPLDGMVKAQSDPDLLHGGRLRLARRCRSRLLIAGGGVDQLEVDEVVDDAGAELRVGQLVQSRTGVRRVVEL